MASNRNLVTTETRGGFYGTSFDDRTVIQNIAEATISKIVVAHAQYIVALTVYYTGQTQAARHGGNRGTIAEINLEPGEFITKIEGSSYTEESYMARLTFISNRERKWGPYGQSAGTQQFTWNAAAMVSADLAQYMGLLYFSGSSDSDIGHLQATFAKYPGPTSNPSTSVRYEQHAIEEHSLQPSATVSKFARSLMSPIITLTVGDERTEFHAYEDILCRLPFFRAALLNGFKETADKKITMPEDEPEIVAALVEFLYVGSYTYTYDPEQEAAKANHTSPCNLKEGSFHLRLFAVAFKYDCQDLAEAAMTSLIYVLQQLDNIDVVELLKETYDRGCGAAAWEAGEDMAAFKDRLPEILKRAYVTHCEEMKNIVFECPALANDLLRLSVAKH